MMNTRIVPELAAALLLSPLSAFAVTDTWDGNAPMGGTGDANFTTGLNWADDGAPASNLATTDLIFGGAVKLSPVVNVPYSVNKVTFNSTAGAFGIVGGTLSVGTGGIVNNDTQTMAFAIPINFGGVANSTINAAAGGLIFASVVVLPTTNLTVTGGSPTLFAGFNGTTSVTKEGAGTMTWSPLATNGLDVAINNGTVSTSVDGTAETFSASSTIAVNGTSTFNINESLTLDGAQLTRATGGDINLAAGKTLTVQNGGDTVLTGNFTNSTASTISVNGAGSTLSSTGSLTLRGGSSLNLSASGSASSGAGLNIATSTGGGSGTVTVDGAGSSLSAGDLDVALNGSTGTLTFTNGGTGTFAEIALDQSGVAGTNGTLNIQSGATVTGTSLALATSSAANTGTITVTDASSALTISGAGTATIGGGSNSSGTLNVNSGGTFNSGTGLTTVNATGTIAINAGTYNCNGNLTLNGGQLTRLSATGLAIDPGKIFTIQNGGDAIFSGSFNPNNSANNNTTVAVTGAGSTLSAAAIRINGNSVMNIAADADVSATTGGVFIADTTGGTITVDGMGSSLTAVSGIGVGSPNSTGNASLSFSNGSTGSFSSVSLSLGSASASSQLQIQSGATVAASVLFISNTGLAAPCSATITGAGSALTLSGVGGFTVVGTPTGGGTNTLNVQNNGTLNSTTGPAIIHPNGSIAITGGIYHSNGDLEIDGGQLTRDSTGVFNLAAGKALIIKDGGDASFTGPYTPANASTITVTGLGSTLTASGVLTLGNGIGLNVQNRGTVSTTGNNAIQIGTGGTGVVVVDDDSVLLTGGDLEIGENGQTGIVTFRNGSTGVFAAIVVGDSNIADTIGALNIQSGSTVEATSVKVGSGSGANNGSLTITGAGSRLTVAMPFGIDLTIGGSSGATGLLKVENGATLQTGSSTSLRSNGTLTIDPGGTLTGAADYSGGVLNLAGNYLPGNPSGLNQTTSAVFGQNITLQQTTSITMELGGTTAGTQHDQIVFVGTGNPHVTWNGILNLVLINGFAPQAGQTFDLFNFDPARDAGTFSSINVVTNGLMPAGLAFNFDELYTSGIIRVVSTTGTTFPQWAGAELGNPGALPGGNHDGDAYDNLAEYALALLPVFPGASEPAGGFHVYPEGERMRVLFWRHIDRTDITIRVQASTDLTNWGDLAVSVNSAPFTGAGFVSENRAHPLSEPGLVEVRDNLNASSGARRYLRIRITLSP